MAVCRYCSIMDTLGNRDDNNKDKYNEQDYPNTNTLPGVPLVLLRSFKLTGASLHICSCIVHLHRSVQSLKSPETRLRL